jgi:hypothetical protein
VGKALLAAVLANYGKLEVCIPINHAPVIKVPSLIKVPIIPRLNILARTTRITPLKQIRACAPLSVFRDSALIY